MSLPYHLRKNFIALFLLQVANYVFPLIAWPLLTYFLGIADFGIVMILIAVCNVSNILTDFGFNLSATYKISNYHKLENSEGIIALLSNIFLGKFFLAILAYCFSYIYIVYFSKMDYDVIMLFLIFLTIFAQACQCPWFFQGIEKMGNITKTIIISRIFYVFLLLIVLPFNASINTVLFCFFTNQLLISLFYLYYVYKEGYKIGNFNIKQTLQELKASSTFFISRVAVSVYTTGNVLILGYFNTPYNVGLYSANEKLYSAGGSIASIVSQALYPHMAKTGNLSLLFKIVSILSIPFFTGSYILSFFTEEIIAIIFGSNFVESQNLLKLFLFLMCITFISVSIGYPGFVAIQRVQIANYTVIIGSIFHVLGLYFLFKINFVTPEYVLKLVIFTESIILFLRLTLLCYWGRKKL